MKKIILITMMALMLMSSASFAAWGRKGEECPQPQGKYRMYDNLTKELNLSKDQITQIKKIKIKYQKETLPITTRIKELEIELHESLIEEDLNKERIKSIIKRINNEEGKIKANGVDRLFNVMNIMTPEQKEKMRDLHLFNKFMGGRMYDKPYHREKKGRYRKQQRQKR